MAKKKSKSLPRKWLVILGLVLLASGLVYAFRETLFWKTYVTEWTYPGDHRGFKVSYPATWEVREWKEYVGNIYPGWELVADQYLLSMCKDIELCPRQDPFPVSVFVSFNQQNDLDARIENLMKIYQGDEFIIRKLSDTIYRVKITDSENSDDITEIKMIKTENGQYIIWGIANSGTRWVREMVRNIVDSFELLK